jgi:putative exporter of polyketide antibiotics
VPLVGSVVLVLMGSVLHAPHWLQVTAVFAHVPDYADGAGPSLGVAILALCFVVCMAAGVSRRARRDIVPD